jgi:hypothetical protein
LSQLYKIADAEKIDRILRSELAVTYGLFSNEFDSEVFVNQIMNWWSISSMKTVEILSE